MRSVKINLEIFIFQDVPDDKIDKDQTSKLDYKIAGYLKKTTPTKRTKFLHHQVNYFYGNN